MEATLSPGSNPPWATDLYSTLEYRVAGQSAEEERGMLPPAPGQRSLQSRGKLWMRSGGPIPSPQGWPRPLGVPPVGGTDSSLPSFSPPETHALEVWKAKTGWGECQAAWGETVAALAIEGAHQESGRQPLRRNLDRSWRMGWRCSRTNCSRQTWGPEAGGGHQQPETRPKWRESGLPGQAGWERLGMLGYSVGARPHLVHDPDISRMCPEAVVAPRTKVRPFLQPE